ncbi:hypothetical protein [Streptomyces sp. HUAS ZL42]|uniref:hypothetical protein n=1 Tax=Streptomyces sp. HUAS ZL42 TaxID=3231715 RepID=UPI00345E1998
MRRWRGRVRESAALLGALAAALALMLWGASSASAGGPTSVLVTSPGSGQAAALYYSDKEYEALRQLLGEPGTGSRSLPPEADLAHAGQINVTWLIHDISPWRMDRVFVVESGAPAVWIHTAANVSESPNGYWHRAERPARLHELLKRLGMTAKASGEGYSGIFPAPWQSEETAATPDSGSATVRVAAPEAGDRTDGWTGWWWAIPGAAAGAVLALVLPPFAARMTPDRWSGREAGPRQELRDV